MGTTQTQPRFIGKLGKKPAKHDRRTLQLASYIDHAVLPQIPQHFDWGQKVPSWPMDLNDRLGDCTCAAVSHMIQLWTFSNRNEVKLTDNEVMGLYEAVSGYDPATGANDEGAYELDVLNYWRQNGVAGHALSAYVALEPQNQDHLRIATYLFGGTYIGLALPISIQDQLVWAVPPGGPVGDGEPGSLGGHAVPIVGYNKLGAVCVTWGRLQEMTWGFLDAYMEEAYALLSPEWVSGSRKAPSGFDLAALQADLAAVASPNPPQPGPVARP